MRDLKGLGKRGADDAIFADEPLVATGLRDDHRSSNQQIKSGRKKADVGASGASRDVLLESPPPRATRGAGAITKREQGYSQVSPRGERIQRSSVKGGAPRWWVNLLSRKFAITMLLSVLVLALYWVSEPIAKLLERPIKSVVVEGEFHFISKQRATELLEREIDGDFLQLDLMRLKRALMEDSWVESVSLNRRWPDTLVVKIAEQKPIARWGDGFLNQRGEIVKVEKLERLAGLPWLQGNEADSVEILQQYQDLSQLLRSRGLEVVALKCDNKKSWRLTIKNAVEIAIGRDQVMEKMRRFVTVYDNYLSAVWSDVNTIDVRYTNGVAVRWVEDSEMAKKHIKNHVASK